jgi:lipopolysaccharide export system protein LptA
MMPLNALFLCLLLAGLSLSGALAQTFSSGAAFASRPGLSDASPSPAASDSDKHAKDAQAQGPQGPTVIDSDNMDYDEKTRIAIFTGENYGVFLKDPQFTVNCDKITAYMRKGGAVSGQKATPTSTPSPQPKGADTAAPKANGLQRAIAEGSADRPVVIVQDKPASNGDEAQHNVGIAQKADYNADTGDVILTGWPRVSQGINTQIATSDKTVMIMNKDGKTMKTFGPSRSIIQQQDQAKKTGKASESPSPSPQ